MKRTMGKAGPRQVQRLALGKYNAKEERQMLKRQARRLRRRLGKLLQKDAPATIRTRRFPRTASGVGRARAGCRRWRAI